jgi:hypothetical protein
MKNDRQYLSPRHALAFFQPTLFRMSPAEFTAHTNVSLDEMKRWNERGWLSFDPHRIDEFDERERMEVLFIKALAHFGLSSPKIENLLFGLKKPFCYDPEETFFCFAKESWITLPKEPDGTETACNAMRTYARNEAWDALEKDLLHQGRIDAL